MESTQIDLRAKEKKVCLAVVLPDITKREASPKEASLQLAKINLL